MAYMTEDEIEQYNLQILQSLNYDYICGYNIEPDKPQQERESFSDVILKDRLKKAITVLNSTIPQEALDQAFRETLSIYKNNLVNNNEQFHKYLTEGITVEFQKNGETRGEPVNLIDWENVSNNQFLAVNQFTVKEEHQPRRPDIVLFINGLPLVVIELKNAADEKANIHAAYNQLQTYKEDIPSLFTYNSLLIISDGLTARAGSLTADYNRFSTWKTLTGETINELETLTREVLNKHTLLDLIRQFTVFEKTKKEDLKTGIITIETVKKIAAYHQYYAVNEAVESVIKASSVGGDRRGGVLWHTQGSGKSLSMVFLTGKLVLNPHFYNPTIIILTDRNDLDDQLFDTFADCKQLLRQDPQQANSREELRQLLKRNSGGIIFTTINKFAPAENETTYPKISDRHNIIVLADEAHRSQYGFKAKEVDIKDESGNIIGKQTKFGFAKYMRDALPHASFVGFTGTPIEETDKNTPAIFGNYISRPYDIAQAVKDGATVPIYYESRLVPVELDTAGRKLIDELEDVLSDEDLSATQQAKIKETKLEAIIGSPQRIKQISQDIVTHFEARQQVNKGKAMIVTMSRAIAADLYAAIIALRPDWHSDNLNEGKIKVVMTASASDEANLVKHHTTKSQRRTLAQRIKDPDNSLELVIVCDMWLTGFDAPCLHTMYIDKPLKSHNLMQAIARINRVYFEKKGGLLVDYFGLATELKKALSFYAQSGGRGEITLDQETAINMMLLKLEVVEGIMAECDYQDYFATDTGNKLNILMRATNYTADPQIKDRFLNEVTALSQAHSLAIPAPEAIAISPKISFFQAIQACLKKLEGGGEGRMTNREIETAIRQVVDQALVSDTVINIFEEAGIQSPDISIISDKFLEEVQDMEHKNLAVELLKKLLRDEVKTRKKTNIVQSRKLSEMLENALRRYRNQAISVTEVIQELINLGKETKATDARGKELKLEPYELAFYDALAENDSAKDVMGVPELRELAIILVERIRNNVTIDWSLRENARAKMKVMVKRLLRKYGYPPDMQALATELVLEQAKVFADFEVETNQ